MIAGLPLQGSPQGVGCCCRLLLSASISCCRLHRLLWAAPSTCPITARALGSGSGRCGSRSGPPSEIFPRKFPPVEALARDQMWCRCLWRCCLPLAGLLPLRRACRSPSAAAVHKTSTAASLPSPFAAELVGLGRALALARACSSTSPNGNVLRLATGFVFTPLGTLHVALHCLRLALAWVHSACCICAFVLGVELDLVVLFILVVFAIEISLSSTLFSSLVKLPRWSHLLQSFGASSPSENVLASPSARPSSTHSERRHRR